MRTEGLARRKKTPPPLSDHDQASPQYAQKQKEIHPDAQQKKEITKKDRIVFNARLNFSKNAWKLCQSGWNGYHEWGDVVHVVGGDGSCSCLRGRV